MGLFDKLFKGRRKTITQESPADGKSNSDAQKTSNNTISKTECAHLSQEPTETEPTCNTSLNQEFPDNKEMVAEKSISDAPATAQAAEKPPISEKVYRVAGTSYRIDNILKLAEDNPDYDKTKRELIDDDLTDERIWKYEFYPSKVELIPEPDNPNDANAIKVVVDGEHIGYIKAGSCAHIHKVIEKNRISSVSCEIGGGPYKYLYSEYDPDKDKDVYTLEKNESNFFATLHILEKK